jgi:HlyD family secretion protein
MTANATIVIDEAHDVLRVPVAALRFRPSSGRGGQSGREGAAGAALAGPAPATGASRTDGGPTAGADGAPRGGRRGPGVYVLEPNGSLRRIGVKPGLSDGTLSEVVSDSLSEGMQVVVGRSSSNTGSAQSGTVNPFTPQGRPRGGR